MTTRAHFAKSLDLLRRAEAVVPGCSQTFSKSRRLFSEGAAPLFAERAAGSRLWDADGNEYIDYGLALGPMILGYGHPKVTEAVRRQLDFGTAFTLPHRLEVEVAETLKEILPCAEMARFAKNGSDATAGAVRVARAYTGRDHVACGGYHGWQDWFIGTTTRDLGVPRAVKALAHPFAYNRIETLEQIFDQFPDQVAGVILEPIGIEQPRDGFLEKVQALARKNGAVLIFDEMVTGFRLSLGGGQETFGIVPDLACYGKAMANGFPLSAVVGRKDLMRLFDEIFFSFTFGGETLSLAACRATIEVLRSEPVYEHLEAIGRKLMDGVDAASGRLGQSSSVRALGYPAHHVITMLDDKGEEDLAAKTLFQQECVKRGVLFPGYHYISYAHSEADIDETITAYAEALADVADAREKGEVSARLEGKLLQPVFRKA